MADSDQVSSTTPNDETKVEVSQGMGDVKEPDNEAVAKVVEKEISDMAEESIDTPQEPPMEITDLSSSLSALEVPPETAPLAPAAGPVTSTTEDATEQLTKEAVTEEAAPTAPAHTEEIAADPVPETEEKAPEETTPKVEETHTPELEVEAPAPVAAPVVEEPVVEEPPVVVSAPPEPAPVVVEEPVIVAEEPPKVAAPVEEPIVVEPPKVEEPIPVPEPTKVEEVSPAPTAPSLVDLLYWRDVKTTGVVFGANLLLLFSLTMCSIISVLSYVALALLSVTVTFRIYKGILQAIQKSDEGHPFKLYLDKEVALSEEMTHKYSDAALGRINSIIIELRRLFLVEDLVDSLKFAVFMWILTYIGALFNGLTLLILGLIAVFSCPIVYEKHQTQIDHYLAMVNNQVKDVVGKVQAKVPGLKKKAE